MLKLTPNHAKTADLAARLKLPRYSAVGLLELLWHFTANSARQGDVGRWSDGVIATACFWDGPPAELVAAFVDAGWLDPSDEHRLLVHDWHEHCEERVKKAIERSGEPFLTGGSRTARRQRFAPTIYVLEDKGTGRIKVGYTEGSLQQRIDTLQTGNPNQLDLLAAFPGTRKDEAALQRRFANARIAGEWFLPEPDVLRWVRSLVETSKPKRGKKFARSSTAAARRTRSSVHSPASPPPVSGTPSALLTMPDHTVPEPDLPERHDDDECAREGIPVTDPPIPELLATRAATQRLARLIIQLEPIDLDLAAELDAAMLETARTPETIDALSDRALERLTRPDVEHTTPAAAGAS